MESKTEKQIDCVFSLSIYLRGMKEVNGLIKADYLKIDQMIESKASCALRRIASYCQPINNGALMSAVYHRVDAAIVMCTAKSSREWKATPKNPHTKSAFMAINHSDLSVYEILADTHRERGEKIK